jgi:hypothetical protein
LGGFFSKNAKLFKNNAVSLNFLLTFSEKNIYLFINWSGKKLFAPEKLISQKDFFILRKA